LGGGGAGTLKNASRPAGVLLEGRKTAKRELI